MSSSDIKVDSIFTKGLTCQNCHSELVTDFIAASQSADVVIRCGNCGDVFSPLQNLLIADKYAWRSLWLGIASVVLICFTGIPAMYFGIRSLLRSQYKRTRPQDRRAAVAGTILGGMFGIFGSFCVFGIGGAILIAYLSQVEAETMEQAKHVLDGVVKMEMPEQFVEGRATKMFGASVFRFYDNGDSDKRNSRFDFLYFPPAMAGSVTTLNSQLRSKRLLSDANYKELSEEILQWDLCGRTIGITKVVFEETLDDQPPAEVCLYYGFSAVEPGIFGIAIAHRTADSGLTEQRIRELIESITPKEMIDVSQRWKEISKMNPNAANEPAKLEPATNTDDEPANEPEGQAEQTNNDQ